MKTYRIHITGVVQGVGFRPFVYGLATTMGIHGWVCNTSAGVDIEAQAPADSMDIFIKALTEQCPPLSRVESITTKELPAKAVHPSFTIRQSESIAGAFQPISPDVAICTDCIRELFDPTDRRYLYPFINCTNCGPRFTIIKDLPYDRPKTTMAGFRLCPDCQEEYEDPLNRRFHAQPIACPICGPHVWLETQESKNNSHGIDAILTTRRMLREGHIVAIKGLGGFHLACDACNGEAVGALRERKKRHGKPFALMASDIETISSLCMVNEDERKVLVGHEKPIVLLERKEGTRIADEVAPGMDTLGMMLPYTPLHHLLLDQRDPRLATEAAPSMLVMTSGNFSEEPIATDNSDALERLAPLADAFLLHDRDIHIRCDDSVVRIDKSGKTVHLRRSRGYAPYPVHLPEKVRPTLAVGGELKNTLCLCREQYAFLSHYIGDMENAETYASFEQGVDHLARLFRIQPEIVACDLHPGYFTTGWAQRPPGGIDPVLVQHHHAHIAACMADNSLTNRPVIGLAYDGTGYGSDKAIWGGEILIADYAGFERFLHLEYLPLPGGDAAIRNPWRIAVGYAHSLGFEVDGLPFLKKIDPQAINIVRKQVDRSINTFPTSSMGRLFDAVAALVGVRDTITYEAQAAIELEVLSRKHLSDAPPYPFQIEDDQISVKKLLAAIVESIRKGESVGTIGVRFHKAIAAMSIEACRMVRANTGITEVALSGGVWQNKLLYDLTIASLENDGFTVYTHRHTPTNDGGIALGQAMVANYQSRATKYK